MKKLFEIEYSDDLVHVDSVNVRDCMSRSCHMGQAARKALCVREVTLETLWVEAGGFPAELDAIQETESDEAWARRMLAEDEQGDECVDAEYVAMLDEAEQEDRERAAEQFANIGSSPGLLALPPPVEDDGPLVHSVMIDCEFQMERTHEFKFLGLELNVKESALDELWQAANLICNAIEEIDIKAISEREKKEQQAKMRDWIHDGLRAEHERLVALCGLKKWEPSLR